MARSSKGGSSRRMVRRYRPPLWHLAFSGFVVIAAIVLLIFLQWQSQSQDESPPASEPPAATEPTTDLHALADTLYEQVDAALADRGIWTELVRKVRAVEEDPGAFPIDAITIRVPSDLPLTALNLELTGFVQRCGLQVLKAIEYQHPHRVEVRCGLESTATTLFILKRDPQIQRRAGQIAIVLDDFGSMSKHLIERFCALPQSLTLAILPNEGGVETIIDLARRNGHKVIVHLPMEPEEYPEKNPGDNAIFMHQEAEQIRRLVRLATRRIPGAIGLNNHMGSRATADARVMEQVLREVKNQNLLFLDSRTTPGSVAYDMARSMDIPAVRRDLFIDPIDETAVVEKKLWELAALAIQNGQAIGIGHDREQTLLALEAVLPRLEARGFRFVSISKLTR